MKYLIKSAKLISRNHPMHLQRIDLLINNGKIESMGENISDGEAHKIESDDLHISSGWIDMHAQFHDPGKEYKEDLRTGSRAASEGGFTRVCLSPICKPIRDSKSDIEYINNRKFHGTLELLPYGSLSKGAEGKELAELADMKAAGAIAFTDGKRSIQNPNLLNRALMYAQAFDGLLMNFPNEISLAPNGVMNEGEWSTKLGLKGIPELAENLMVSRDLFLSEYTEGKLHFACISSPKSLDLIKQAKSKGQRISCDVAAHQLLLSDDQIQDFDSRFKLMPPLRSKESVKKLILAVKQGVVDAICSDHQPEDIEAKKREFDHAAFGMIASQTAFSCAYTALSKACSIEDIIDLFTTGPERVLGLKPQEINLGALANLSLFDPSKSFVFTKEQVLSKSHNSPLFGMELKGKVIGTFNNKKYSPSQF